MDRNAIIRLATDLSKGVKTFSCDEKTYNYDEAVEVLRQALIDANGGSTKFDYKTLRRNKVEIFEIIEELVPTIIMEGLTGNEFWNRYVDYRNIARGDKNEFVTESDEEFVVTVIADGIATPRRQRIGAHTSTGIETSIHAIRIYDEFSRFMAGIIDWPTLCDKVAEAFQKAIWADIYTAFSGAAASYSDTGSVSNTVDEDDFLELIAKTEAATGKKAVVYGTMPALRALTASISSNLSDQGKNDIYNQGYLGKYLGTDVFKVDQVYGKDGSPVIDNKTLYIIATDDKFIKFVDEGDTLVDDRDWTQNADMTLEYRMLQTWGVAIFFSDKGFGTYTIL